MEEEIGITDEGFYVLSQQEYSPLLQFFERSFPRSDPLVPSAGFFQVLLLFTRDLLFSHRDQNYPNIIHAVMTVLKTKFFLPFGCK
jgi:hypothetical protein